MITQKEGSTRFFREQTKQAIYLALESRWEEAVKVNQDILVLNPGDAETYNRLGKALLESGLYDEAKDAFREALAAKPGNKIAHKNLERLEHIQTVAPAAKREERLRASIFLEEKGKTCVTRIQNLCSQEILSNVRAGHTVFPMIQGNIITIESSRGEHLGQLEPRLAFRLKRLMQEGNEYAAAVTSATEQALSIIIRETYQHPSQAGIVSFPGKAPQEYPSFVEEVPIPYDRFEEEFIAGSDDPDDESVDFPEYIGYRSSKQYADSEDEDF